MSKKRYCTTKFTIQEITKVEEINQKRTKTYFKKTNIKQRQEKNFRNYPHHL